jgi:hypothetical protein
MRTTLRLYCLACLFCGVVAAQNPRDDWKQQSSFDLESHLTHSLADAPFTSRDRAQVYRVIDNKTIHDSFTDSQRKEEQESVMSSRVGSIGIAQDSSHQILVQGPKLFCGAGGNCPIWIFIRRGGQLQLALEAGAAVVVLRGAFSYGFRELALGWHMSAEEERFSVFRWNGSRYDRVDCYRAKFDLNNRAAPPAISDCEN